MIQIISATYLRLRCGGKGKHAQRKGKSTSGWVKKQKVREATTIEARRKGKQAKKFYDTKKDKLLVLTFSAFDFFS